MATYNALDNQKNAAQLYWQLWLEEQDLRAAIDYNRATDVEYSKWSDEEDSAALDQMSNLLDSIKTYCGDEVIEAARHGVVDDIR